MTITGIRPPRALLAALAGLTALCGAAQAAPPPPELDAATETATEKVREVLREDRASSIWGADPAEKEVLAARGEPFAATVLSGAGHSLMGFNSEGEPVGSHLFLLHVRVEGSTASATECGLRLGRGGDQSCPPVPLAFVDCTTWSVPVETVRAATRAARAALFARVYEKKYISDPHEELDDDSGGVPGGVIGGVSGGTTNDFVSVVNVLESGKYRVRVAEQWVGYEAPDKAGHYARAAGAARILWDAFDAPKDVPLSPPPPAVHAEFSRLFNTLPFGTGSWWWVRERMVLMAGSLGLPADLELLKKNLNQGSGNLQTNSLDALARRTGRDPRCNGSQRVTEAAAAAVWKSDK